ncbi:MAG: hypothetical protein LBH43_19990 [Treponema sp.]|jgi:hypothetical protein|nr:hypothetical protein [Treponema sp.]
MNLMREWVKKNLKDYPLRRYFGFSPKGHHPEGEQHKPDEASGEHEYAAQMFLFADEVDTNIFSNVEMTDAPKGLFLVGDVVFDQFNSNGTIDIGTSMQKSSQFMYEYMKECGGYDMDLNNRCFYEEHIFPKEWFDGADVSAEFKLWLPIKRI